MSAVLAEAFVSTKSVPLAEAVEFNPKPERASIPEALEVSFVPMAAVEAASGRMDPTQARTYGGVKKGFTYFRDGDVLFAKITPCMENGKMAVAHGLHNGIGFGSTEFHVLRPREGVDARYVYYFVSSATFRREAAHHMTGAVGQKRVPLSFLQQSELPLPPLKQQQRIVDGIEKQFSRLDEAVANLQRVKANLKRYKAATLEAAIEGRLVPTEADVSRLEGRGYESGGELLGKLIAKRTSRLVDRGKVAPPIEPDAEVLAPVPEGWCWASLDQLSTVVRGGSPRPAGDPRYFGGPIPWITVGPITADESDYLRATPGGLTEAGKERSRHIEAHTLLLTNSGATLGVPKIALIAGCINDGVAALLDVDYPLKSYLVQFLRTKTAAMRNINQGAAQPNLNTTIIKATAVPLPPLAEQHRIVAEVDRRLSIAREVEAEVDANLKRAQALRQAVLQRAFASP